MRDDPPDDDDDDDPDDPDDATATHVPTRCQPFL
jgi:hypothetical protein